MRNVYRWIRTKAGSQYGPATDKIGPSEIYLRNLKGSHRTSISAPKTRSTLNNDDDRSNFVRLEESVAVDFSPRYVGDRI